MTNGFSVEIGPSNNPPLVSFAITEVGTNIGDQFTFDASAAFDPEGDPMLFEWDFGDQSLTTGPLVTHIYDEYGPYIVTLTVSDDRNGGGWPTNSVYIQCHSGPIGMTMDPDTGLVQWTSSPVSVRVTDDRGATDIQSYTLNMLVGERPPIAVAGSNRTAFVAEAVDLDGSGSNDPYLDPLTYAWTIRSAPASSLLIGLSSNTVDFSFRPDQLGAYGVELVLDDGLLRSAPTPR